MSEKTVARTWQNLTDDSFEKIQDLQAVIATNKETIEAFQESIDIHSAGLVLLNTEEVQLIKDQFEAIIERFTTSRDNLINYNENATNFLNSLKETNDPAALQLIESILKIVAFK